MKKNILLKKQNRLAALKASDTGFTLIEIMLASTILALVLLAMMSAYGQLKVRGGLVAADVGILSSGDKNLTSAQEDLFGLSAAGQGRGFVLLYDERVNGFLAIEDLGNLKYTRRVQVILHL